MDAMNDDDEHERHVVVRSSPHGRGGGLAVSDTGRGIDAEHLPKLFDAFFTTKKDGIGLGLAIARSIVEAHAGRIWAEDHSGPGATFRLTLPIDPALGT
jgi:signal transduction histidine kinase